jgi:hypothetical protein
MIFSFMMEHFQKEKNGCTTERTMMTACKSIRVGCRIKLKGNSILVGNFLNLLGITPSNVEKPTIDIRLVHYRKHNLCRMMQNSTL